MKDALRTVYAILLFWLGVLILWFEYAKAGDVASVLANDSSILSGSRLNQ
jgi:hypothetical protein